MKKLLSLCVLVCMAFAVSAKSTPLPSIKKLDLSKAEAFKKQFITYSFKYDMTPTGTPGMWSVSLGFFANGVISTAPVNIQLTITSPVSGTYLFPQGQATQVMTVIDLGSYPEYTYPLSVTPNPLSINGNPIDPTIPHI